jgi:glyoxylase-like metal-dependent hydrolase (beta-lactamase superfamily II)
MWSTVEIAPGAWFIQRDWLSCNHFLAKTPRVTMIDTGYRGDIEETVAALRSLGVAPEEVELIVNTHCHCDHAGGNRFIVDRSGCSVWMHTREKTRIDRRDDVGTWWRFHDTWAEFFDVDRGLEEDEEISFGALTLRTIYAPGHSSGLMVLYCEELKALFSADVIWQGDMGVINPIVEGDDALERAMQTLDRLARMAIETVYPGHGSIIAKPQPVISRLQRKLERFAKDPMAMHMDHMKKMIAYILLTKGGMPEAAFFDYLMNGLWYPKLVQRYYDSAYQAAYQSAMEQTVRSKMITRANGYLYGVSSDT